MFKVSFTGHRPKDLLGYKASYRQLFEQIKAFLAKIVEEHPEGVIVITGGAQGVDQMAFWAAYRIAEETETPIHNTLAIPFEGQENRWSERGIFSKVDYRKMLAKADSVNVLSKNTEAYARKLDERNHWMVDHSDLLICCTPYDNILERSGGTGNCVRYAKLVGKKYVICKLELPNEEDK